MFILQKWRSNMKGKKKNTEDFKIEMEIKFPNQYDLSKVIYKAENKIIVGCKLHPETGYFNTIPSNLLKGQAFCPKCKLIKFRSRPNSRRSEWAKLTDTEYYSNLVRELNMEEYYQINKYDIKSGSLEIKHSCGEVYFQKTASFYNSLKKKCIWQSCPNLMCSVKLNNKRTLRDEKVKDSDTQIIIDVFLNPRSAVSNKNCSWYRIKHLVCDKVYEIREYDFMNGIGCSQCRISKGEEIVANYLIDNKYEFEREKKFMNCKYKRLLPFDFYFKAQLDNNKIIEICIEYDGEHHFNPIKTLGGIKRFNETKAKDIIRNEYCLNNNIKLIRIPYTYKSYNKIYRYLDEQLNNLYLLNNSGVP